MIYTPTIEDRIRMTRRPKDAPVVMRQDWLQLLFLHWRVSPELVQKTLPPGLTVDTFEGDAYIGLVPFTMRNVRPIWSPSVPGLSHFHEINVRTYVHANSEPGVWFYSLDAANPIAVALARMLFHLPYYFAAMRLEVSSKNSEIAYVSQRRHPGVRNDESVLRYTPDSTIRYAKPGSLDYFLCERYLLYSQNGSHLYSGRVHHTPYPLQDAVLHDFSDTLVGASGFPGLVEQPPVHIVYAGGVSVEVFGLRPMVK